MSLVDDCEDILSFDSFGEQSDDDLKEPNTADDDSARVSSPPLMDLRGELRVARMQLRAVSKERDQLVDQVQLLNAHLGALRKERSEDRALSAEIRCAIEEQISVSIQQHLQGRFDKVLADVCNDVLDLKKQLSVVMQQTSSMNSRAGELDDAVGRQETAVGSKVIVDYHERKLTAALESKNVQEVLQELDIIDYMRLEDHLKDLLLTAREWLSRRENREEVINSDDRNDNESDCGLLEIKEDLQEGKMLSPMCKSNYVIFRTEVVQDLSGIFDNWKGKFALHQFSRLRSGGDFGELIAVNDSSLQWQGVPIQLSMCKFNGKFTALMDAKDIFKSIMGYMKDRFYVYPVALAQEVVLMGMQEPSSRDEIYCQLIKQTTNNPDMYSLILGWKLLYLCCSTFPPVAEELKNIVLSHAANFANQKVRQHIPFDTVENIAANSFLALRRTMKNGCKTEVPTLEEIKNLTDVRSHRFQVQVPFGDIIEIALEKREFAKDVCEAIAIHLNQAGRPGFIAIAVQDASFEQATKMLVLPDQSMPSLLSYWEAECKDNSNLRIKYEFIFDEK